MGYHHLGQTQSYKAALAIKQENAKISKYPGAVRANIQKLMHQIDKNKDWQGDTSVEIRILGCTWNTEISHKAIRILRNQGYKIRCVGGFAVTSGDISRAFTRYNSREGLQEYL